MVDDSGSSGALKAALGEKAAPGDVVVVSDRPQTPPPPLRPSWKITVSEAARIEHNEEIVLASKQLAARAKYLVLLGDIRGAEKLKRRIEAKAKGFRAEAKS